MVNAGFSAPSILEQSSAVTVKAALSTVSVKVLLNGLWVASPSFEAVIVASPAPFTVSVLPLTVATEVLLLDQVNV